MMYLPATSGESVTLQFDATYSSTIYIYGDYITYDGSDYSMDEMITFDGN